MRFVNFSALILGTFNLFIACKNTPNAPKETPSVSASKNNIYHHFVGKIGEDSVTMDLVETKSAHIVGELPQFDGYFTFLKNQEPLPISGTMDSTGTINLTAQTRKSMDDFEGKITADGTFTGRWKNASMKASTTIVLKETTADGALLMDVFAFEDSIKLFDNVPNSPQATFAMDALLPAKNTEGSLFDILRTLIIKELKGDSVTGDYKNLQLSDVQKSTRDSFFSMYKKELEYEKSDMASNEQLSHYQQARMAVVSNTDGLLSLAFTTASFTGGAHGNYGTQLRTYNIKSKKQVSLNDILKPNYQATLNAALLRAAKNYFGLKPNESLAGAALVETVEANDNFAVTRTGILFNYTPYEIASYADGEIQLFIRFEDIKSIVK
jgi:hypothetical protein